MAAQRGNSQTSGLSMDTQSLLRDFCLQLVKNSGCKCFFCLHCSQLDCRQSSCNSIHRIEDASTAIEMLRMVSVVLLPADNASSNNAQDHRIPVVHSPFVRSVSEYIHVALSLLFTSQIDKLMCVFFFQICKRKLPVNTVPKRNTGWKYHWIRLISRTEYLLLSEARKFDLFPYFSKWGWIFANGELTLDVA